MTICISRLGVAVVWFYVCRLIVLCVVLDVVGLLGGLLICSFLIHVSFVHGNGYFRTSFVVRPGHKEKWPSVIALHHVDSVGEPAQA
jgi:hypothetical protein